MEAGGLAEPFPGAGSFPPTYLIRIRQSRAISIAAMVFVANKQEAING